jgi:hypothetical protein
MKSNWYCFCGFILSFFFGGSISAVAAPSMIEAVDTIQSEAPVSPTLTPTPSPTPVNNSTKINSTHIPIGRARPIASYGSNIPGNFSGGGLFDMSGLLSGASALGILNLGSDRNRFSVDLHSHREIWRKAPTDADECQLNMTSSVKRVGPYLVVGWPHYSNQYGGNVNGLGKVCVYDAATGDFINSTVGWNQGELFGSKIIELKDSQNPSRRLVAITAPYRWSAVLGFTVGGVDIYDLQAIISNGFFAAPIFSIQGFERFSENLGNQGFGPDFIATCNSGAFGQGIANGGDLNSDGIDDLVISDPGYNCFRIWGAWGGSAGILNRYYASRIFVYDTRRGPNGSLAFSRQMMSRFSDTASLRGLGHDLEVVGTATEKRIIVSNPYSGSGRAEIFNLRTNGVVNLNRTSRSLRDPAVSLVAGARFGWTLKNVGDVTGDGVSDLAVGSPAPGTANGFVEFYSGQDILRANNSAIAPFSEFYTQTNALLGYGTDSILGIPDMDGDGKNEVAIGAMAESTVYIVKP